MADPAVAEALFQKYPWTRALFGIPEVASLILEAVDPNIGFDPNAFQAKLFQTEWWRTTPEPQRQAFIKEATDPATFGLEGQQQHASVLDWATSMGVAMDDATRQFITRSMQNRGEDINAPGQKLGLRQWLRSNPGAITAGGRLDGMTRSVYGMARDEFFLPVEWWWAQGQAIGLATGEIDEAALRQELLKHAANTFPHLGDWIMQGKTPAEVINPLRQVAADELEVGIEQIDIGRPEWKFLTGVPNEGSSSSTPSGTQGGWRLPTYSEVQKQARSDTRWWDTSKGQEADATGAMAMLQTMGIRG